MIDQNTSGRPAPAAFGDYREYLQAMIRYLRATQRGFSYRNFARRAGYNSPNFLKLVAEGKRNLSTESIRRFSRGLGLTPEEAGGFEALVLLNQARTDEERNLHYQRLREPRRGSVPATQMERDQYEVYSLWYGIPIRELLLREDFVEDPKWIAKQFRRRLRPGEAAHALRLLERTGLALRDAEGRLRPADVKLETPPNVQSLAVRNYHRSILLRAGESLDGVPVHERNVTSLTFNLSRKQYESLCERLSEFRQKLLDEIEDAPPEKDRREVHAVAFMVVPLTEGERP